MFFDWQFSQEKKFWVCFDFPPPPSDLSVALQKLLVEDRADFCRLFWWAFYGTIDTGKDTGKIQMMNVLFNQLGFLCLRGDNSMKCKQRQGADVDCLSAIYRTISGWGCWKTQRLLVPLCPFTAPCQRVPKHCSKSHPLNHRARSLFNHCCFTGRGTAAPGGFSQYINFPVPWPPAIPGGWAKALPPALDVPSSGCHLCPHGMWVTHIRTGTSIHRAEIAGYQEPPRDAQSALRHPPGEMPTEGFGQFTSNPKKALAQSGASQPASSAG